MTEIKYKLSIIVPVYNVEKYVEKAIESILNQDFKDLEIIIIDDGSTDNSATIINKYDNYKNCKIIHKENAGLGAARNTGLREASGEYIMFLDSDDFLEHNSISKIYASVKEDDLDVLQCSYRHVNEYGDYIGGEDIISSTNVMSGDEWIKNGNISYGACFCIYRHEFLFDNNLEFMEGVLHEDMDFTLRATYLAKRIRSWNYSFYNYLIRPSSITTEKSIKRCTDFYIIANHVEAWVEKEVDRDTYLKFFKHYIDFLYSHVVNLAIIQGIKIKEILCDDVIRKGILSHLRNSDSIKYRCEYYMLKLKLYGLYETIYKAVLGGHQ